MPACTNHPLLDASGACARCGQPFCPGCLVEFLGELFCGPCRNQRLAETQGLGVGTGRLAGTGAVEIGRWLQAGAQIVQQDMGAFVLGTVIAFALSALTCGVLIAPLTLCGISMLAFRKIVNPDAPAGSVIDGCRRFLWAFLALAIIMVGASVLQFVGEIPSMVIHVVGGNRQSLQILAGAYDAALSILVDILVSGATFFVFADIAATNVNSIDAIKRSWTVVRRNFVMFCLAAAVFDLICLVAALPCGLGLLFAVPITVAAQARAYADHFGLQGWQDPSVYTPPAPYAPA